MGFLVASSRARLRTVRRDLPEVTHANSFTVFQLIQEEMAVIDRPVVRVCLLMGVFIISSCTVRLETARLKSPDVTFTALNGSFKVSPGDGFPIPNETPYCYDNSSDSIGSIFKAKTPIAAQSNVGKKHGGKTFRIDIAGETEPLYGLLLFCSMPSSLLEYANLRTHESITVPENYRNTARSGQVTSILRLYKISKGFVSDTRYFKWMLWLADKPEKLN